MKAVLHITSGDCAGAVLARSGIAGEILVWHDMLYLCARAPGWPDDATLDARARFLEDLTGGGLSRKTIRATLDAQYAQLATAGQYERIVLWFDACLFDQAMLAHILACMTTEALARTDVLCVDAFPGIEPYHGLGQLQPQQMASVYHRRCPLSAAQAVYARVADAAFASQDPERLATLAAGRDTPLPWLPAAAARWLQEQPDPVTGLGRLATLALDAIRAGCEKPADIFAAVSAADTPPQYWGDITLWATINALAHRTPPLVRIDGPAPRLPQWEGGAELASFRITCAP